MTLIIRVKQRRENSFHRRRGDAEVRGEEQNNFQRYEVGPAFFASSNLRVSAPPVNLMAFNSAMVSAC
jgi:hypothetical protein